MSGKYILCSGLVVTLLLAGCDSKDQPEAAPTATLEATPPAAEPLCPLTGRAPLPGVDLARPAVAVKIENSPQARPQHGLDKADVVFEELVEGGITRFMAIYHCGSSSDAGPVRSARFDDPKLALPFTRVLAYSGSNGLVNRQLEKRKMVTLNELNQASAFFRVPPGTILVHNLFVRTEKLRDDPRVRRVKAPAEDLFEFGDVQDGGQRARRIRINFNASITIEYRYKNGEYERFEGGPFMTNTGKQISVPNVLIQEVKISNSRRLVDIAGNPSPVLDLTGKARALLFRDGKVIKGTWHRNKGRFNYRTKKGEDFVFARGPIWIELVPSPKGQVKGSFSYN